MTERLSTHITRTKEGTAGSGVPGINSTASLKWKPVVGRLELCKLAATGS